MTNIQTESKKRLRIVREWLQMSQAQLAKELHMNTEAYRRIEVGKVNSPIEILYELENKFDISASFIICGNVQSDMDKCLDVDVLLRNELEGFEQRIKKYQAEEGFEQRIKKYKNKICDN